MAQAVLRSDCTTKTAASGKHVWSDIVTIERPIEGVFDFVSTSENDPTRISASLRHQRASSGPMRVGMTTEVDVTFLGKTARYTWEATDYEPPG